MSDVMTFENENGIGVLTIDSPPVNALSAAVRQGLYDGFHQAWADDSVKAIVLICGGRTFFAGADISEFGKAPQGPNLLEVMKGMEDSEKLVVAAIHGTALGGGLETALNAHYRIAVPSAKVGLPEVNLGLLPGAGGTQRLPRLVGVPEALEMMTTGRPIGAKAALEKGVIDALAGEDSLRADAIAYAQKLLNENAPAARVRDRNELVEEYRGNTEIFAEFRKKNARKFRGFKAPENIIKCVEAACEIEDFDAALKRERELFTELVTSDESAAQRYVFFGERATAKVPDIPKDTPLREIKQVGVLGAGTMGGGITMNFLNIGIPVTLVEQNQEALDRGIGVIRKNYEVSAKRGRMSMEDVERCMGLITPSTDKQDFETADLIIEAVYESMPLKLDIFEELNGIAKEGAILASNTSFLDIDEMAKKTDRPGDVLGMHFFSPANVMPLLEIVRGAKTDKDVLATVLKLSAAIRKTPVVSGVCHGFIANRAMSKRSLQAQQIIFEGVPHERVDEVIYEYGFAMGPFMMGDLVGLDVGGRDSNEKTVNSELVRRDRLGQKKNGGYYDYDENRRPTGPSPIAKEIIAEIAAEKGIAPKDSSDEEILARLLYPVVNECAKLLEEGIALRGSDVDIAMIKGYNWPVYRGGPLFWADLVGLDKVLAGLKDLEAQFGETYKPSALLEKLASEGGKLSAYQAG